MYIVVKNQPNQKELQSNQADDLVQNVIYECDEDVCCHRLVVSIHKDKWHVATLKKRYESIQDEIEDLFIHLDRVEFDGKKQTIVFETEYESVMHLLMSGLESRRLVPDELLELLGLPKFQVTYDAPEEEDFLGALAENYFRP